ncbi:CsbD-like [Gracilibacillus ureilyticus]|uniref:CsbD-like n=1 Tax=Gracilibacillus ureilyticus TaxID=531814 RepID=A0A1H9N9K1_9BACI|nr:CsbD family protein [Gracilibacillus ureilyticus]SER32710.1 CsbD-like [Gracilibacillus ureilyticus]
MSNNNGMSDKVKSNVSKVKGEAKDQIGNAVGNSKMVTEGKKEKLKGKMQEEKGHAKDDNENHENKW